jgi:hypothetical protein
MFPQSITMYHEVFQTVELIMILLGNYGILLGCNLHKGRTEGNL